MRHNPPRGTQIGSPSVRADGCPDAKGATSNVTTDDVAHMPRHLVVDLNQLTFG